MKAEHDRLIVSYNNADFAVTAPGKFGEPVAAAVSRSGRDAVIAPKQGRPYLFNLTSSAYIVALPGRPAEWRRVGFLHDPGAADGITDRVVGITQDGAAFGWPYFADLRALKQFAADNRPFVNGNERLPMRSDVACRMAARPESDCPVAPDDPAEE